MQNRKKKIFEINIFGSTKDMKIYIYIYIYICGLIVARIKRK